ncbi:MAG: hypothetical protein ACKOF9_08285 [Burkholderiales bacterium]
MTPGFCVEGGFAVLGGEAFAVADEVIGVGLLGTEAEKKPSKLLKSNLSRRDREATRLNNKNRLKNEHSGQKISLRNIKNGTDSTNHAPDFLKNGVGMIANFSWSLGRDNTTHN